MSNDLKLIPTIGDLIFIIITFLLLLNMPCYLFSDGSTGWHIACGDYILKNHTIPHTDFISFSMPNKTWIAYEWLCDLLMAICVKIGGLNLLATTFSIALGSLFVLIYNKIKSFNINIFASLTLMIIGIFASCIHWLARPHVLSYLLIYFLVSEIDNFSNNKISQKRILISTFFLMLLYANIHPSFLIGFVVISIYLFCNIINKFFTISEAKQPFDYIKVLLIGLIATFINPYSYHLYFYIFNYLKGSSIINQTLEYMSPVFHGALSPTNSMLILFCLVLALNFSKEKVKLPKIILSLLSIYLMLNSVRFIPIYVIIILPIIAELLGSFDIDHKIFKPFLSKLINYLNKINSNYMTIESGIKTNTISIIVASIWILIAASNLKDGKNSILNCNFSQYKFPTTNLQYIVDHKLPFNQGLSYDNWGGYIYYKIHYQVLIDDRADFYGEKFYNKYLKITHTTSYWQNQLDEFKINWVLFPKNGKLSEYLKNSPNWQIAATDKASYLFIRKIKS